MIHRPSVGVGVFIVRNSKLLLGKRKNAHGDGTWSLPGGHLEFGESFEACAIREVFEETGLIVQSIKKLWFTNDIFFQENKHFVTIFMWSDECGGEPQVLEPEKCEEWLWFDFDKLPSPLFLPVKNLIEQEQVFSTLNSTLTTI